ncbi:MAG: flagellar FliJ family protein [Gemmatimonadetes bacterium]|nr:flagellar FliJ family protein [Gemmatimonadota bacterium]
MGAFRFSLDRLLALRQRAQQDAAVQTARAQALLTEAEGSRDDVAAQCDAARARMQPAVDVEAHVAVLRQAAIVRDSLQQHLEVSQVVVATRSREMHQQLAQLHARTRDTRVLERLRDRQHEAWQVEAARIEQVTMDGIAQARFLRRQGEGHSEEATQ